MLMKLIWWSFATLIIFIVLLLSWCQYTENPRSYFATYEDAKNSGIMDAGWMPTYIPRSSKEIHETHNLDTNAVHMSFKYSQGDTQKLEKNCYKIFTSDQRTVWNCGDFESKVTVELINDGTATLSSHSK
jgi:hypothetical protein